MRINKSLKKSKSQAALEFLVSYGWAFLVMLIMIASLSYFNVLSPSKLVPQRCSFGNELGCVDFGMYTNGLRLRLRNEISEPIMINSIDLSNDQLLSSCASSMTNTLIKPGEVKDMIIACDFSGLHVVSGEKFKVNVNLAYNKISSGSSFVNNVIHS